MQVRDLYAACVGFVGACGLLALERYLVEPSVVIAAMLVTCAIAFVIAVACYASAIVIRQRIVEPATVTPQPVVEATPSSRTGVDAHHAPSIRPKTRIRAARALDDQATA